MAAQGMETIATFTKEAIQNARTAWFTFTPRSVKSFENKHSSSMSLLMNYLTYHLCDEGKRPSTTGRINKFRPRKRSSNPEDMMGVEVDKTDPTSVSGLWWGSILIYLTKGLDYLLTNDFSSFSLALKLLIKLNDNATQWSSLFAIAHQGVEASILVQESWIKASVSLPISN